MDFVISNTLHTFTLLLVRFYINTALKTLLTKKITMKFLNLITWVGIVFAIILMIMGFIDFMNGGGLFGLKHSSTFFTVANTALLGAIVAKVLEFTASKN